MQDNPRAPELLEAIGDFLMKEIMPFVKDEEALAYKTLVSWNMLGVVSREFREGESSARAEYGRLAKLLGREETPAPNYPELLAQLEDLNQQLAGQIRAEGYSRDRAEVWNAVKEGLREKLRVSNPRFGAGAE